MCVRRKSTKGLVTCEQDRTGCAKEQTVDGNSIVGNVNSNGDQFNLNRSNGNANSNNGVGLSVR